MRWQRQLSKRIQPERRACTAAAGVDGTLSPPQLTGNARFVPLACRTNEPTRWLIFKAFMYAHTTYEIALRAYRHQSEGMGGNLCSKPSRLTPAAHPIYPAKPLVEVMRATTRWVNHRELSQACIHSNVLPR